MAAESRRWKHRDPSWYQIVLLYGIAAFFARVDSSDGAVSSLAKEFR